MVRAQGGGKSQGTDERDPRVPHRPSNRVSPRWIGDLRIFEEESSDKIGTSRHGDLGSLYNTRKGTFPLKTKKDFRSKKKRRGPFEEEV